MSSGPKKNSWAAEIEQRIAALEKDSHVPFDFTDLIKRLDRIERLLRPDPEPQIEIRIVQADRQSEGRSEPAGDSVRPEQ